MRLLPGFGLQRPSSDGAQTREAPLPPMESRYL